MPVFMVPGTMSHDHLDRQIYTPPSIWYRRPAMADPLIDLFAETLQVDPAELGEASSPDTVEQWDSLGAMHLVTAIEERFQVRLTTKEIMKMQTISLARATLLGKGVDV